MPLEPISFSPSGNIQSIFHDPNTQTLMIRFKYGNRVYKYLGVSSADADGFSQSLSASDYLRLFISPGHSGTLIGALPVTEDPSADLLALTELLG